MRLLRLLRSKGRSSFGVWWCGMPCRTGVAATGIALRLQDLQGAKMIRTGAVSALAILVVTACSSQSEPYDERCLEPTEEMGPKGVVLSEPPLEEDCDPDFTPPPAATPPITNGDNGPDDPGNGDNGNGDPGNGDSGSSGSGSASGGGSGSGSSNASGSTSGSTGDGSGGSASGSSSSDDGDSESGSDGDSSGDGSSGGDASGDSGGSDDSSSSDGGSAGAAGGTSAGSGASSSN